MLSKVFKIGTVLLACVCLVSFMVFPVSASSISIYQLPVNQPRIDNQSGYIEYIVRNSDGTLMPFVTFWQLNCDNLKAYGEPGVFPLVDVVVNYSGIFLSCDLSQYEFSLGCFLTFSGGSVNSAGGYNYWSDDFCGGSTISRVAFEGTVVGFKIYGNGTLLATNINNDIKWNMSYSETSVLYEAIMSLAQASANSSGSITQNATDNANKIQQNQNQNTDKIIQNQEENQSEIINGWEGADNIDDGTANNYKDSESAALGGKTDAEIQSEVNSALDFDIGAFDSVKVGKIHNLFDRVLAVTGGWQSLFVLSLTLGLGAFLIGRRYG